MSAGDGDPRRWVPDLAWLWGVVAEDGSRSGPGNDGTPATLRLTVRDGATTSARERVDAWLAGLPADEAGLRGRGGWVVEPQWAHDGTVAAGGESVAAGGADAVVVLLTGAGEDVADALEDAAQEAFEALAAGTDLQLTWKQMPRG